MNRLKAIRKRRASKRHDDEYNYEGEECDCLCCSSNEWIVEDDSDYIVLDDARLWESINIPTKGGRFVLPERFVLPNE